MPGWDPADVSATQEAYSGSASQLNSGFALALSTGLSPDATLRPARRRPRQSPAVMHTNICSLAPGPTQTTTQASTSQMPPYCQSPSPDIWRAAEARQAPFSGRTKRQAISFLCLFLPTFLPDYALGVNQHITPLLTKQTRRPGGQEVNMCSHMFSYF